MILAIVAAVSLTLISCNQNQSEGSGITTDGEDAGGKTERITITVDVEGKDGEIETFDIITAGKTLREALEQEDLISGDEGEFGLYVTEVNGETADWDADSAYWAFYKGDELLMTGVDSTNIADGDYYRIVYTK